MTPRQTFPRSFRIYSATAVLALLTACAEPVDFDLRGYGGGFSTAQAAKGATANRPAPDNRGIISYPNYQVAVARRGDTLTDVARRTGTDLAQLSGFNGIPANTPLRDGEIIALPVRVSEPSPATGAISTGPIRPANPVDVTTLAGNAIEKAPASTAITKESGEEPIRHKVARGETAYTIARRYKVPVRSLAQWNGLGTDYAIREGQYLLIPVAAAKPPEPAATPLTSPGQGSPTPEPPSSTKPLPQDAKPPKQTASTKPVADLGKTTKPEAEGRFLRPVKGTVIRDYAKGRNEGINIKAAPGTGVCAADNGTVAAITESAEGVPIVVVRHKDNILTVYANVTDVAVKKGDQVRRGQTIAKLRSGDQSFVHFEVRKGFDSVDPNEYLG